VAEDVLAAVDSKWSFAISPDDRWIAMGQGDGDVLLWPVPDPDRLPIDTLPKDELVARLKALTNARAVRDDQSPDGWEIEWEPFPGWEDGPGVVAPGHTAGPRHPEVEGSPQASNGVCSRGGSSDLGGAVPGQYRPRCGRIVVGSLVVLSTTEA